MNLCWNEEKLKSGGILTYYYSLYTGWLKGNQALKVCDTVNSKV